ncbi:tyrosine-type recombinase/integrase [Niameybacter massiliensis]|uniref:Tyrosine-type recombinase/integrase n=1 Tax=Holtiella tumoricola TaxID=3018743 RepID=A0AA42DPF7_9FIRM|nr:tyrosine-type recombinase/integrase [Holtiella tumoricola]MDA3732441.1 tyrosine-type recombinase/integrase [Holtiella tumoricola]
MTKIITYTQALKKFSHFLYVEGCATSTAKAYLSDMQLFEYFLKHKLKNKIRYLNNLTTCEIQQYKDFLFTYIDMGKYDITTIQRKFNTLKTFFRYLNKTYGIENILIDDRWGNKGMAKKFKIRAGEDSLPLTIDSSDINTLLKCISSSTDKLKYRDLTIFIMLITTGARRSDVLSLKWSHINFYKDELRLIHIKNCNGGIVKLPPLLKSALSKLLALSSFTDEYVFMSRQGNPLSESAFNDLFHKWISKSNIQHHYTRNIIPHAFRHTFITDCIRKDISSEKIIEYTGHTSSDALIVYKHLVPKDHESIANLHTDTLSSLYL